MYDVPVLLCTVTYSLAWFLDDADCMHTVVVYYWYPLDTLLPLTCVPSVLRTGYLYVHSVLKTLYVESSTISYVRVPSRSPRRVGSFLRWLLFPRCVNDWRRSDFLAYAANWFQKEDFWMLKDNRDAQGMSDLCWIKAIGRDEQGDGQRWPVSWVLSSQKRGFVPDFYVV